MTAYDIQAPVGRRALLRGAMLAGAGLAFARLPARAAPAQTGIIDVHHHFTPPFVFGDRPGRWGIGKSLAAMDANGITKAVLSPATGFAQDTAPKDVPALVRRVNEFGAGARRDHPARFGQFVFLPLPDIDASLREMAYGLDTLKANGVLFTTSYGSTYVSDLSFAPIWQELDRRGAVAYFHPRAGACCETLFPKFDAERNWLEIPYDTGRAIIGLLLTGAFRRYRNVRWLFAHSGGAIPALSGRIHNLRARADLSVVAPDGIDAELRRLHYETGNAAARPAMAALRALVPDSQILFGTDHPYVTIAANLADLRSNHLPAATLNAILRGNAVRLMPDLVG